MMKKTCNMSPFCIALVMGWTLLAGLYLLRGSIAPHKLDSHYPAKDEIQVVIVVL